MTLVWVYAVVPGGGDPPAGPGVDGEVPRLVARADLAAVVGEVAQERFDEDALAAAMADLGRLEELARAHHAVIARCAGTVAPLRLATVYRDEAAVRAMLGEREVELGAVLARLRGRREWGVKVYVEPGTAPAPDPPPADRPGTAYLRRRHAARDRAAQDREQAREVADAVHARLTAVAAGQHRFAAQDARLSGRAEEMVLNAAYLVDHTAEGRFRSELDDVRGATVELTGPWPPFTFAEGEEP